MKSPLNWTTWRIWPSSGKTNLEAPLHWRKPRTVVIADELGPRGDEEIAAVFGIMAIASQHTFQISSWNMARLAKWFEWIDGGAETADELCRGHADLALIAQGLTVQERVRLGVPRQTHGWPLQNVWLGARANDQPSADMQVKRLLRIPATVRFLRGADLQGPIDLDMPRCDGRHCGPEEWGVTDDQATPWCSEHDCELSFDHWLHLDGGIDWVSVRGGCNTQVAWLRTLRDQCAKHEVPFFLESALQAFHPDTPFDRHPMPVAAGAGSRLHRRSGRIALPYLDGAQHLALPKVEP